MNGEFISIETARIMSEIEKENKDLQDRIDEAINYIKRTQMPEGYKKELLNILQGENNE